MYSTLLDNESYLVIGAAHPFRFGSWGIGYEYHGFTFDYAYRRFAGEGENVSHAFSVGYVGEEPELKIAPGAKEKKRKIEIPTFRDVAAGHYAKEAVERLAALGIMSGFADGKFRPDKGISREELAAFLVRARGLKTPKIEKRVFKDIAVDHWSAGYIKAAVDEGWITGYPDGKFHPNWPATRAETVAILIRFDALVATQEYLRPFRDVPLYHWAQPLIAAAKEKGMLAPDKYFHPEQKVDRAEIAKMLYHTGFVQSRSKLELGE